MSYTIEYDSAENMIFTSIGGKIDILDLKRIAGDILSSARQENCFYILTDVRNADLKVSVMEIFSHPENLSKMANEQGLNIQKFKRVLVAAGEQEILRFYETVCRNRGHDVTLFHDIEDAKNRLHGRQSVLKH